MSQGTRLNHPSKRRRSLKALFLGLAFAGLASGSASASLITVQSLDDFTGKAVTFTLKGSSVTFSDVSSSADPSLLAAVGVMTTGGARVAYTPLTGEPASLGYPTPGNFQVFGPSNDADFTSFATATAIPFSVVPFAIGLSDTIGKDTYYGYALFDATVLKSYTYETMPNTPVVLPVPLPSTAPMFGMALLAIGALGFGARRVKNEDTV